MFFYIIGEMFRTNELFVDLVAASYVFIFTRQCGTLWIYTRF